jgi:hypothetical protein
MELKIVCECGTKFKFDVEPVNGRMPAPVNCPECGADATDQANAVLRSMSATPAAVATPIVTSPAPAPVPIAQAPIRVVVPGAPAAPAPIPASAPVAAAPAASPAPGGLRITKHAAPVAAATAEGAAEDAPPTPPFPRPMAGATLRPAKQQNAAMKTLTTIGTVVVIIAGLCAFGFKWYRRIRTVVNVTAGLSEGDNSDKADAVFEGGAKNLWYDKCTMLFIKHTNHVEVAEVCRVYWKEKLHKQLTTISTQQEANEPGEFELIPAHNGWVRLMGVEQWPVTEQEAFAQYLSGKFGTLIFEWRTESFADTYHFGVYDHGQKKFHSQMDVIFRKVKGEGSVPGEVTTTTGDDFAKANGYKPKKEHEFDVLDADKMTQRLGMKLWDEKDGTVLKGTVMKETGPAM